MRRASMPGCNSLLRALPFLIPGHSSFRGHAEGNRDPLLHLYPSFLLFLESQAPRHRPPAITL